MSLMAAAIQGLPPLPKSLSGLLSFNKEAASNKDPAVSNGPQQQHHQQQQQQQQLSLKSNRDSFPPRLPNHQEVLEEALETEERRASTEAAEEAAAAAMGRALVGAAVSVDKSVSYLPQGNANQVIF